MSRCWLVEEEREGCSGHGEQHMQRAVWGGTEEPPEGEKQKGQDGAWYESRLQRSEGQPGQGLIGIGGRSEECHRLFFFSTRPLWLQCGELIRCYTG